MRKMKDSGIEWIGEIPENWDAIRLGALATFIVPMRDKPTSFDGDIPWIRIEDFDGMYISKSRSEQNVSMELIEQMNMKIYPVGTVLCSCSCNLGQCAITTAPMCSNQTFIGVVPSADLHNRFLYYVLSASEKTLNNMSQGAIQSYLSQNDFSKFKIAISDVSTQIKVADYLDEKCVEIDALIASKENTNALLKEHRQSIIYEAVTKGLNPDAPMKDSGIEWIGMIPEHWSVGKLGYFIDVFNGDRSSNYPSGSDIQESGVPFLTSSNLEYDILDMSDSKYISEEKYASMSGLKMELDDIIYCLRGSVGKCSINKTEICGTVASSLMGIRCKKMVPDYLLFVLKSAVIETQNVLFMNGTCAANLSAENVCGYLLPIPSETEQREIATHLQGRCVEMDNLISASEATIQKLKEYRQSIIYEAVTGKIEI